MSLATAPLSVVEITVYDPSLGTTRVLRYASGQGFTTKPSESPANTYYDARVKQPIDISRTMFSGNSTMGRSTVGIGDLILSNDDGALDDLVNCGFDGQAVVVRTTTVANPSYPSDFTSYTLTATGAEFTSSEVRLQLRDRQQLLDVPLQPTKYAGSNALPSGLEGVADLKGKPKPVCYGVVKNVPAPCVNTSKLIYQVNDGAIASVDAVYDRGISLRVSTDLWEPQTSGTSDGFNAGTTAFGLLFLGGEHGTVARSSDGASWSLATAWALDPSFPEQVTCACSARDALGNEVLIVGGERGKLATSSDGVSFTTRSSGFTTSDKHLGVAYSDEDGLAIAVGYNGKISTSSDGGATWTSRTSGFSGNINSVIRFKRKWFALCDGGYVLWSTDGSTWTNLGVVAPGAVFGLYTAATDGTRIVAPANSGLVYTTEDGFAWTARRPDAAETSVSISTVLHHDGIWVSLPWNKIITSRDGGITWQKRTMESGGYYAAMAALGPVIVVGGASGTILRASGVKVYSTQADLLDDTKAPAPGTYGVYAAGGYFRLGSTPAGIVTADVTQGANAAARTHAQIWKNIALRCPSLSASDLSSSDIAALDIAQPAVAGVWFGPDDESSCAAGADRVAQSCGAWWAADASGLMRVKQFTAPSGTPVLTITANDIKRPIERIVPSDETKGIPTSKVTHRWGRYYQTITTDVAAGVDDASRAQFAQEWRDVTATDANVLTAHPLSVPLVVESLFASASDASTEAARVLTLRKVRRDLYEVVAEWNAETRAVDIGSVIALSNVRFGLSVVGDADLTYAGLFRVLDVRPNAAAREVTFVVWGAASGYVNLVGDDGAFLAGSDGAYIIGTTTGT